MSSAFDTIKRSELLDILKMFLDDDEVQMIRYLLSDTTIEVKSNSGIKTEPFNTNIGSPQGDGLSGCLFTIYFENSLRKFRDIINVNPILTEHSYAKPYLQQIPEECIYADDADFISNSEDRRSRITLKAKESLATDNLLVNDAKTEHTTLIRTKKDEEEWRNVKKLGSLLGDTKDVMNRKQQATVAMRKMDKVWIRHHKISIPVRLKLYNCYIKPVLLYNSGTWGLTKSDLDCLDSFHRQQLRQVLNVICRNIIKNKDLYERTNEQPLSLTILKNR